MIFSMSPINTKTMKVIPMKTIKNTLHKHHIHLYIGLYFILNLFTLTAFPLIHSDEAWLAGLTNDYIRHKTVFVSESFFDLMPRTVHTLKSFYHLLQIPIVQLLGNTAFSIRLLSLIAAVVTLYFIYYLFISLRIHSIRALLYTIIFSLNLQFIYAGHFGRQEMILLMVLSLCLYLYYKNKSIFKMALLLGLSIGFHPNAFIITTMIGFILLKDSLAKTISLKHLLSFIGIVGGFAALHVAFTLLANPNFLPEYWAYGQTLHVDALPSSRLVNLKDFYLKLYYQVSGTYYIPPMQGLYITGGFLSAGTFIYGLSKKFTHTHKHIQLLMDASLMVFAFNLSVFVIGRFNTTSITFAILPVYLLILLALEIIYSFRHRFIRSFRFHGFKYLNYVLIVISLLTSLQALRTEYQSSHHNTYTEYLDEIQKNIDADSVILGNLSSGFIFHDHTFYDIRNLAHISRNSKYPYDRTIEDYIKNRNIDTIIYYEEYDYIHRNQKWEILYGDDESWYNDLQVFLREEAKLVYEFESTYYGSRIIRFLGDHPGKSIFIS